jgi:hypothetical protein
MKKFLALLLAVVMVMTLAACGSDADKKLTEQIQGSWTLELTMDGDMMGVSEFTGEIVLPITITFDADGIMTMHMTAENKAVFTESLETEMYTFMTDMMYSQFEDMGMTREEADAAVQEYYGQTMEEVIEELMAEVMAELDADELAAEMESSSAYIIKNGKLYTGESTDDLDVMECNEIELSGNTLKLLSSNDASTWEDLNLTFPITLTRAD